MKKLAVILLAAVTAVIVLSGFAVLSPSSGIYVYDDGDYLTAEQEQQIQNHILEVRDKVKSDFFVVFTENPASDDYRREAEKACDRFISAGGGYGDDHQTICFYVDMVNRARLRIRESLESSLTIQQVAEELGVSYSNFRKLFKEHTGLSPATYQQELRLQRAKELLSTTDMSIKEIAYRLDFESPDYFSAKFKLKTGRKPSEFRQ